MIQIGTSLNVIDNCGAKKVYCIKLPRGFKKRYAYTGDIILVSVKSIRSRRKLTSKVKKGELYSALILRTKYNKQSFSNKSETLRFLENSVVLLNKQNRLIGTRIFGSIPKFFRYTKFMRLISLSTGTVT